MRLHNCHVGDGTKTHIVDLEANPQWWQSLCGLNAGTEVTKIDYENETPQSLKSKKLCNLCIKKARTMRKNL